jgi:hypothetical protein
VVAGEAPELVCFCGTWNNEDVGAAAGVVDGIAPNSGFVVFAVGVEDWADWFPKRDGVGADDEAGFEPVGSVVFGVDCA